MPHHFNHENHPVINDLMDNNHYLNLLAKHEALEAELASWQKEAAARDEATIKTLKVKKLWIAEQLEQLRRARH